MVSMSLLFFFFFFQAEDGIRDWSVTGVQTCALPIWDIVARCVGAGHDPTDCSAADHARTDTPVVKPDTEMKGFKLAKQLDSNDHHVRSTIVVLNGDKKVVGFIPHPEDVQGVVVG